MALKITEENRNVMKFKKKTGNKKSTKGIIHRRRVPREFLEEYEVSEEKLKLFKKPQRNTIYNPATIFINTYEVFSHQIHI